MELHPTAYLKVGSYFFADPYSLDGTLRAAAGMEETQNFDLADYGLTQFRLATWEGFLFINFSQNDKSLIDYLGDLPEILGSYNFSEMICTRRKIYDVACNWKVYIENQREAYHVSTVHRTSLGSQASVQLTTSGNWSGAFLERGSTGSGVTRRDSELASDTVSDRQSCRRYLFRSCVSSHVLRVHTRLHVVDGMPTSGSDTNQGDRGLLFSDIDGRAGGIC